MKKKKKTNIAPPINNSTEKNKNTLKKYSENSDEKTTEITEAVAPYTPTQELITKNIPTKTISKYSIKTLEKQQEARNNKIEEKDIVTPFSIETLELKWNEYIELKEKKGEKRVASILKSNTLALNENYQITFTVSNTINKEELEEDVHNLLSFLKEKLNNYTIKIEILKEVHIENKKKYIYTDNDKLKELINKNPTLSFLKKEFELEFET